MLPQENTEIPEPPKPEEAQANAKIVAKQRRMETSIRKAKHQLKAAELLGDEVGIQHFKQLIRTRQGALRQLIDDNSKLLHRSYGRESVYSKPSDSVVDTYKEFIERDKKDYEVINKDLGRYAPPTLEEYRQIKYNDSERWNDLNKIHRDVKWMKHSLQNYSQTTSHKVPFTNQPNSVVDKYVDGEIYQRRFFGKTGKPRLDIDFNQGNPKYHEIVPHSHEWTQHEKNKEALVRNPEWRILTKAEEIANKDVIKNE